MPIHLNPDSFDALIFDLDGTLVDSAPAHFRAYNDALAPLGIALDWDWYLAHLGLASGPLKQAYEAAFGRAIPLSPADFAERQVAGFLRNLHLVREKGVVADVARQWSASLPLAVASSGNRVEVISTLQQVGLLPLFEVIVTSDNVARLKPSPDLFLEASRRLNVPAARCLVFEDSDQGMAAAAAAKMRAIDVRRMAAE